MRERWVLVVPCVLSHWSVQQGPWVLGCLQSLGCWLNVSDVGKVCMLVLTLLPMTVSRVHASRATTMLLPLRALLLLLLPLLALLLLLAALTLFFFTSLAGRLWCGYACPQTVWTEAFLWIEQACEGDRYQRLRLDRGPVCFYNFISKILNIKRISKKYNLTNLLRKCI